MTDLAYITEIANEIGGGGDRENVITLRTGVTIWIAYGQIGVYPAGDVQRENPLALWDYAGDVGAPFFNISDFYTVHTGGGCMLDIVTLRGLQEINAPGPVCLFITDDVVSYRAFDDNDQDCPFGCEWGTHDELNLIDTPLGAVRGPAPCPLAPFGLVYV